jgi:hypothetical protein
MPRLSGYISKENIWSTYLMKREASQIGGKLRDWGGLTSSMDWFQRLLKQNSPGAHRRVECKSIPERRLLCLSLYLALMHVRFEIRLNDKTLVIRRSEDCRCCLEMRGLYNKPQRTATCTSFHFSSLHNTLLLPFHQLAPINQFSPSLNLLSKSPHYETPNLTYFSTVHYQW